MISSKTDMIELASAIRRGWPVSDEKLAEAEIDLVVIINDTETCDRRHKRAVETLALVRDLRENRKGASS